MGYKDWCPENDRAWQMEQAEIRALSQIEENRKLREELGGAKARIKMNEACIEEKNSNISRLETFVREHLSRFVAQDVIVDALRDNTRAEELLEAENRKLREHIVKIEAQVGMLKTAIDNCIDTANNRESEWGDRAVSSFEYLYRALSNLGE